MTYILIMIAVAAIYIICRRKREDYRCPMCYGRGRRVEGGYLCGSCGHFERMGRE